MRVNRVLSLLATMLLVAACSSGSDRGSSDGLNNVGQTTPDPQPVPDPTPDPNPDPGSDPVPTLDFNQDVALVDSGGSVSLTWNSQNADGCTASGGWSGDKDPSGGQTISSIQSNQTFSLSCTGVGGTALAMVSVSVNGALQISWQAPTENVDGTPISGLSAYRIHYGATSGSYDEVVEVAGDLESYSLNLILGEYFIAMTALDLEGDESGLSNEIQKQAI